MAYRVHRPVQNVAQHSAQSHSHKNGCAYIRSGHAETHKCVNPQIHGVPPKLQYRHYQATAAWLQSARVRTGRIFRSGWRPHEKFWIPWRGFY